MMTLVLLLLLGGPLVDEILTEFGAPLVNTNTMTNHLEKESRALVKDPSTDGQSQ